ncbi:glycoside hydrolase family 19 protein [Tenacibaculum sp. nBUS_03]|uniref:glycoside hydrolase family 19 protein n=1 Tax=Tenacibaculum sp. nBUS_03 TaxID=3395320 RepID=UPI003EBA5F6A
MKQKVKALLVLLIFVTSSLMYANSEINVNYFSKKIRQSHIDDTIKEANTHPLLSKELWNKLFPYRFGSKDIGDGEWVLDPKDDFYTYSSFIEAIDRMSKIKVIFDRRCGTNAYKITRIDKTTGEAKLIRIDVDYNAPRNSDLEVVSEEVDYGAFLEEGDTETRKRELAAFFANISHETTGGWATAPGGRFSWGLHFREEPTDAPYAYPDTNYPPTPGKSYKGRGPIQLSYNYNYGPASEFIFGDKQVLLDNPDLVIQDAALAFQTAIWFWMTPQYPKPSAHNVITNKWVPNDLDTTKNRVPGLGMTVNIINGGVECGQGTEKPQVIDRIGYYERYTGIFNIGTDMDGVNDLSDCGCKDMSKYGGDAADLTAEPCAQKPAITFTTPINNQVIQQNSFTTVGVNLEIDEKNSVLTKVTTQIGGQSYNGTSFSWTPNAYKTYTLLATATFQNGATATNSIKVIIWDGVNLDCTDIPEWSATRIYDKPNNYVKYNNTIYRNKWYAANGLKPDENGVWEQIKVCTDNPGESPVVTWIKPTSNQVFETEELQPIAIEASAIDNDGNVQSFSFQYKGTTIAAVKNGDTYSANFTPSEFGVHTIAAIATDNTNRTTTKIVSFVVKKVGGNTPPTIRIVTPIDGEEIVQRQLSAIELIANVADDDVLDTVEFRVNSQLINVSASGDNLYSASWLPSSFGTFTLEVRAVDSDGESSTGTSSFSIKEQTTDSPCDGIPDWVAKVYAASGTKVVHNGAVYRNKWYASSSEEPGKAGVWGFIEACDGGSNDFCGSPAWVATKIYNSGDRVYYDNNIHEAKWWTQNNIPGASNEWKTVAPCAQSSRTMFQTKAYPNIVQEQIHFSVRIDQKSPLKIELYDHSGRMVKLLVDTNIAKGTHQFHQNVSDLKSGIYFCKIYTEGSMHTKKLIKE